MPGSPRKASAPRKAASKAVKPAQKKRNPRGRPCTYTPRIALIICTRIAEGESLRQICEDKSLPDRTTIYDWLRRHDDFAHHYTRAREEQADTLADEIIAIADEQPEVVAVLDKTTGAVIDHKLDHAFLQWQKNRIDARKWTAMKLKPKKYGDKTVLSGDEDGAAIKIDGGVDHQRLFELIRSMEMKKRVE